MAKTSKEPNDVVIEEGTAPLFTVEDSKPETVEPVTPVRTTEVNGMVIEDY